MRRSIGLTFASLLLAPALCLAQGRVVIEGGEALVKQMVKRGGATAAREVAEMGGDVAVRETLERAAREGGEQLAARVSRYALAEGPVALRAVRQSPARMVAALDEMPQNLVRPALSAAAREPDTLVRLVASHGAGALETAARHPGVGSKLITTFGDDGLRVGRSLTTDEAVVVARHADEIAKLSTAERSGVMQALSKSPARVVGYLERHPKVLLTTAGVVTVIAMKDEIIGTTQLAFDCGGESDRARETRFHRTDRGRASETGDEPARRRRRVDPGGVGGDPAVGSVANSSDSHSFAAAEG
jgi:hypothetical protein